MHSRGLARFALTTVTIAEVLTGPSSSSNDVVLRRYRNMFKSWRILVLDAAIAETAARLRGAFRLKLSDAVQAASALAIGADALVTHDRDFSKVTALRVIS